MDSTRESPVEGKTFDWTAHNPAAPYQVMPRLSADEYDSLKSDIAARARQSVITKSCMAAPSVSERIAERTAAALSDPETKRKHVAGLNAALADPAKRKQQAILTRKRTARWRACVIAEATEVIRQMPAEDRTAALAQLAGKCLAP